MLHPNEVETIVTERFRINLQQRLALRSLDVMNLRVAVDRTAADMAVRLTTYLQSNKIHREVVRTERVPETWLDGVKLALFPKWALKRWPANTRAIECAVEFIHVCPHLHDPGSPENRHAHLAFVRKPR
jgi:hypothetical protein